MPYIRKRGVGDTTQQPMTATQAAAWYNALPWYVKPFATIEGGIESGYCFVNSSDPICATNLYTDQVAAATAPGTPTGYNSATGTVVPSNTTGQTDIAGSYAQAIADALPTPDTTSTAACLEAIAAGDFSCVPGWAWALLTVLGVGFFAIEIAPMMGRRH